MPGKVKLIFNPIANLGRAQTLSTSLHSILTEADGAEWVETAYPNHARELARQAAAEGCDLVVALGGDGTVHEVLNGLMDSPADSRPAMGVVPTGSGNDFSFAVGVPPDPATALRQVLNGTPHRVDIGLMRTGDDSQFYWANAVGLGFDTLVTIHSRHIPVVQGFALYFAAVLQTILLNYVPFHVSIKTDGKQWEDDFLMMVLCNGQREGGGFYVSPGGNPSDGVLDYVSVQRISRLRMLLTLPHFMKGTQSNLGYIGSGSFKTLELESNRPLFIHSDGEILAGFKSKVYKIYAEIIPDALDIIS